MFVPRGWLAKITCIYYCEQKLEMLLFTALFVSVTVVTQPRQLVSQVNV